MPLTRVVLKRLAFLVVVVLGVTVITFGIANVVPGDPARMMAGPRASTELVQQMRHQLGLDQPLHRQYLTYLGNLARGDFGMSIQTRRPVADDLFSRFPATIELMLAALVLSLAVGVPLGVLSAVKKDRPFDHAARGLSVLGISLPSFWLALVLLFLVYGKLDLLPGSGRLSGAVVPPSHITGLYLVDGILTGNLGAFADALRHLVLPAATLAMVSIGAVVRLVRSSMLEVLGEDYIKMARASGLPERTVHFNLALRNALIPLVTVLGLSLVEMLYGAVITETVFAWPGTGSYVVNSVFNLDFPVIMAFAVVVSVAYVLVNLVVDLLYTVIDPQIREVG